MKKVLISAVFMFVFAAYSFAGEQARNIELIDVPTANTLLRGEVRADIKFYPGGGLLSRVYVGVFDRVIIGGAINIRNLIGSGEVDVVLPPKFLGKIRITEDEGALPAISLGYEGESYLDVKARGAFLSVTKEIDLGGVFFQLTGSVYTNEFSEFGREIDAGAGLAVAITRDFVISGEFDSILLDESSHLNFNIGYFFDPIEIDIMLKFGLSEQDIRQARALKILYITYF